MNFKFTILSLEEVKAVTGRFYYGLILNILIHLRLLQEPEFLEILIH